LFRLAGFGYGIHLVVKLRFDVGAQFFVVYFVRLFAFGG
jgi:hypothetical protein